MEQKQNLKQNLQEKFKRNETLIGYICIVGCVVMIIAIICLFAGSFNGVGTAVALAYDTAYDTEKSSAYDDAYNSYKSAAEQKYHVSNRVSIHIDSLKEKAELEVLKVSDVEFIIESETDNSKGIVSWLEVPGEGTYVVDLQAGEYIVDEERKSILVRIPYPELTNIQIDYANVQKILFENDIFNDSYKIGEDLAKQQLDAADVLIKKEFTSNQNFYLNAQDAAKRSIEALVKQLNPDVSDLTVDVEFY